MRQPRNKYKIVQMAFPPLVEQVGQKNEIHIATDYTDYTELYNENFRINNF